MPSWAMRVPPLAREAKDPDGPAPRIVRTDRDSYLAGAKEVFVAAGAGGDLCNRKN